MASFPIKGGKGQKFEPGITHIRCPIPLKPVVQSLAGKYRELYGGGVDPDGTALIRRVEDAIVNQYPVNACQVDTISINDYDDLRKELTEAKRKIQSENESLRAELAEVQRLADFLWDGRRRWRRKVRQQLLSSALSEAKGLTPDPGEVEEGHASAPPSTELGTATTTTTETEADPMIPQGQPSGTQLPPSLAAGMNAPKLARRLTKKKPQGLYPSTVTRALEKGDAYFKEWSAKNDPDNIAWRYSEEKKKYVPVDT